MGKQATTHIHTQPKLFSTNSKLVYNLNKLGLLGSEFLHIVIICETISVIIEHKKKNLAYLNKLGSISTNVLHFYLDPIYINVRKKIFFGI